MALRHRKLFPALTAVNQTGDCQGFCEAACPYNCNPYPDYYLWASPPPPQPLSTQNHNVVTYVVIAVIILAVLFLAVSYYLIARGSPCGWFASRNNRQQQQQPQSQEEDRDEEFVDEIRPLAHPIWFIARMGLNQSTINSITIIKYRKGEGLIEGTVCSVCLNEFQQGETLRLLPKCSHAFHISCIDAWLRSHTNCPLCRARIVDEVVGAPVISVNRNPDNSNAIVNPGMENPEIDVELGHDQERNEACEGRGGADEEGEMGHVGDERILKGKVESDRNGDLQLPCDPGDNH